MFTHPTHISLYPKVKLGLAVQGNGDMWQMELKNTWGAPWPQEMAVVGGGEGGGAGKSGHLLLVETVLLWGKPQCRMAGSSLAQ